MRSPAALAAGIALPLLAAALPVAASAQGTRPPSRPARTQAPPAPDERVEVRGRVLDAATGRPVVGARLEFPAARRTAFTDTTGSFVIRRPPAGEQLLTVSALGYKGGMYVIQVGPELPELRIGVREDPILLEEIRVVADRFQTRMARSTLSGQAFSDWDLALGGAADLNTFLRQRVGLVPVPCYGRGADLRQAATLVGEQACVRVRGVPRRPRLYVDEIPVDGMEDLGGYHPSDIARMEVYQGGAMIRVYTKWFIQSAAKRGYRPLPLGVQ